MTTYHNKGIFVSASSKHDAIYKIVGQLNFRKCVAEVKQPSKEEIIEKSKQLIKKNYERSNDKNRLQEKYLNYKGVVNEQVLKNAWIEGWKLQNSDFPVSERKTNIEFNKFKNNLLPIYLDLINGKIVVIYRGLVVDKYDLSYITKNLLDRNSWTSNLDVAEEYARSLLHKGECRLVLKADCSMSNTNLVLSAFTEGLWCMYGSRKAKSGANDEIVINRLAELDNVKVLPINEHSKELLENAGFDKFISSELIGEI